MQATDKGLDPTPVLDSDTGDCSETFFSGESDGHPVARLLHSTPTVRGPCGPVARRGHDVEELRVGTPSLNVVVEVI